MQSEVSPFFGRAPYFLILGMGSAQAVVNPNVEDRIGVGVQSAQLVVTEGARVVITNDISVQALQELNRLGVKVYAGVKGTAAQALEWYQAGRLTPATIHVEEKKSGDSEDEDHGRSGKVKGTTTAQSL